MKQDLKNPDVVEGEVLAAEIVADVVVTAAEIAVVTAEAIEATVEDLVAVGAEEVEAVAEEIAAEIVTKNALHTLSKALERQGLVFLGSVSPETYDDYQKYQAWIREGNHGNLFYLEENSHCRQTAQGALPNIKTVIVFAYPYAPDESWPMEEKEPSRIAAYARFQDYHSLMKELAEKALSDWNHQSGEKHHWRVAVDTVPILERAFAKKTGTGFIGKNTCFIHEERGSFLLLGEILTSIALPHHEKKSTASCGSCTLCQVECPTGALSKDYQIDARKCLSYWTIEQRGPIPEEFWPGVGKYWFGCDICQLVCPFNKQARANGLAGSVTTRSYPSLFEVATMNQAQYERYFGGTALTRAKRNGLRRNALIAMAVCLDPLLNQALSLAAQDDDSPIRETIEQIKRWVE